MSNASRPSERTQSDSTNRTDLFIDVRRFTGWAAFVLFWIVFLYVIALIIGWLPNEAYIAKHNEYTGHDERTYYDLTSFVIVWTINGLNQLSPLISALAALAVAFFTWRLFVIGRYQHDAALKALTETRRTADAAISAQRPWLKVIVAKAEVQVTQFGVQISADTVITNIGNTPATHVFANILFRPASNVAGFTAEDAIEIPRKFARSAMSGPNMGRTIFPNDPLAHGFLTAIMDTDIKRAGFDATRDGKLVPFLLALVVSYRFGGGEGETPIRFGVWTRKSGETKWNTGGVPLVSVLDGEPMERFEVRLIDSATGLAAT